MRKKILTLTLFVGAMLLLAATGVLAASPVVSNPGLDEPTPTPTVTPTVTITNPVAAMIAAFFGLDYTQVQTWHDGGAGYGNMATALFFAEASGKGFEEIMDLRRREEGGGWGYITKELGLDIRRRDTKLGHIMSGRATPVPEQPEEESEAEVQSVSTKGPLHEPKGWEHGKGQGLGKDQNRGHGRRHNK